jgi:hypothetical protein
MTDGLFQDSRRDTAGGHDTQAMKTALFARATLWLCGSTIAPAPYTIRFGPRTA